MFGPGFGVCLAPRKSIPGSRASGHYSATAVLRMANAFDGANQMRLKGKGGRPE